MTYWVSTLAGDDTGDGQSYATAKQTVAAGLALLSTKGDVLNIVNDGSHVLGTAHTALAAVTGTSWTDFGYKIQGTDASGDPAMTTLVAQAAAATGFIQLTGAFSYTIIQGLKIDATGAQGYTNSQAYVYVTVATATAGPLRIRWCEVDGGSAAMSVRQRLLLHVVPGSAPGPTDIGYLEYCYFHNVGGAVIISGPTSALNLGLEIHHNVFVDGAGSVVSSSNKLQLHSLSGNTGGASSLRSVHHNTWVMDIHAAATYMYSFAAGATTSGQFSSDLRLHSNIVAYWADTVGATIQSPFYMASATPTAASRTIGYNLLKYEGLAPVPSSGAGGWYRGCMDPDLADSPEGDDTWPTDTVLHSGDIDHSDVFYAPGTPWVWAEPFDDGGYTITLPSDLRVVYTYRTVGLAGSVPGATADSYDVAPTAAPSTYSCTSGLSVSGTLTIADSDGVPVAVTAVLVDDASHGLLALDPDGSFVYTASGTFAGTDTFTFRAYDGELYSATTTATIAVAAPAVAPGVVAPGDPVENPAYVDVLPWFEPDLKADVILSLRTKRNRVEHYDSRAYLRSHRWREATHRVITLATNTTRSVTLGGVHTAQTVMVKTSALIDVGIDSGYWPVEAVVALSLSNVTNLMLRNNSTTDTAVVVLVVVD